MANHLRYIRRRNNGVYYYERRVPQTVQNRTADWNQFFGGRSLFRCSLRTRSQLAALSAGQRIHERFEQLLAAALGQLAPPIDADDNATRPITLLAVERIVTETRERIVRPWRQHVVRAEMGMADDEELQRLIAQREYDADLLRGILLDRKPSNNPRLPDLADEVDFIVRSERFNAPAGSEATRRCAREIVTRYSSKRMKALP